MTENRVAGSSSIERSLSALYRADVRRDAMDVRSKAVSGSNAEDLCELEIARDADAALLERLARTPDAVAVQAMARALSPWSVALAADMRRARSREAGGVSRVPYWGWVSLAAAAGLAVFVVGLGQREAPHAPMPMAAQPALTTSPAATSSDILFADAENLVPAASPSSTGDSIFIDSLDG